MVTSYITFENKKVAVHNFLDMQITFINDMEIVCHWFHNILCHEIKTSERFVENLELLHDKISHRYQLTNNLPDDIAGKQEILRKLGEILEKIHIMIPKK